MMQIIEQEDPFFQITKLYQSVAQQYGVSARSVEHARYAIESAYNVDPACFQRIFRSYTARPSSAELLAQAVEMLRIQLLRDGI